MWWLRELLKNFTPAEIKRFLLAHRYSLAVNLLMTLLGLLLFFYTNYTHAGRTGLLQQVEDRTLDFRFQLRGPQPVDDRIVIVAIDSITFNKLGWPFPRFHHARVIERLRQDGARAIAFDIYFNTPDPNSPSSFVQRLSQEVVHQGDAISPSHAGPGAGIGAENRQRPPVCPGLGAKRQRRAGPHVPF